MPQARSGRQKVGHYLKQRMPKLYTNLNAEQQKEIQKEGEEIMAGIEATREKGGGDRGESRVYGV
jgi:hypothetical protein